MGKWIYENSVKWGKIKCVEGGKKSNNLNIGWRRTG